MLLFKDLFLTSTSFLIGLYYFCHWKNNEGSKEKEKLMGLSMSHSKSREARDLSLSAWASVCFCVVHPDKVCICKSSRWLMVISGGNF